MQTRRGFLEAAAASCAGVALAGLPFEVAQAKEQKFALTGPGQRTRVHHRCGRQCAGIRFARWRVAVRWRQARTLESTAEGRIQRSGREESAHAGEYPLASRADPGSNEALGKQGATIIAHENTRLWLARKSIDVDWAPKPFLALPKIAQPNKSFYTTDKLDFGGETIALGHLGQAHTDGDLYAYLPKANVLVAGGVVSSAGWPLLDWQTGGWIGGLVGAYDRLLKVANDATRVIPADGAIIGRRELQAHRDMYFQIFDRLVKQLVKGMGPQEAYESGPAKEYEAQWGDSHTFVIAAFKSLWGHYAP